jgi:DNA-directed RNA polymerase omega subunit
MKEDEDSSKKKVVKETEGEAEKEEQAEEDGNVSFDSKYRLIFVAAQRSKQLQMGARPRVEMEREIKALRKPSSIGLERIRSAVQEVSESNEQ